MTPDTAFDVAHDVKMAICERIFDVDPTDPDLSEDDARLATALDAVIEGVVDEFIEHPPLPDPDTDTGQRPNCCADETNIGEYRKYDGQMTPYCKRCGRTGACVENFTPPT